MKRKVFLFMSVVTLFLFLAAISWSQEREPEGFLKAETFSGLKFRSIGPALMSGRISDIAIDPTNRSTWYVAVGSGGVWKTTNAGITWTPIFDNESSYSIGCVTLDPKNPLVVWVGTGENSSGRHVGYGDGIYKSEDGGRSWSNWGLKESEHIAKILIDPRDSSVIYVAAEGPLWNAGGERGLYKSVDGGCSWEAVLQISENTGVTDIAFDPGNPDIIYAAAYQRRRHVAAFIGGGPESGIYKSTDGGKTWQTINKGLPKVDMGKIGLAVSPQKPKVIYATVETYRGVDWDHNPGGFFRSTDGGKNWQKRSDYFPSKSATGPHYYQELFCDPHRFDVVYQMDAPLMLTEDGGKTWDRVPSDARHGDHHAMAFDPEDPNWLLLGTDGGLYESFDRGKNWRYFPMPITQFYKIALDYDAPFYNVIGGTQDNSTQHGPARTGRINGIFDTDWVITVGGDGYACAIDPEDPDTIYGESQVGNLVRYDRRTGERIDIQPQPEPDDPPERWNWDSPIIISPHSHTRLYFGSQRLWRSDDRGDYWTPLSPDLSRGEFRLRMEYMDRTWGPEAVFDQDAMSYYGNLTAISESPLVEGLIYCGTDDGLIQVTEDGGDTWRRVDSFGSVPEMSFVNEIKASLHDPDTVFAVFDNHKRGDLKPYIVKSTDRGRSWSSISGDLPDRDIVWSVVQDHIEPDLLFAGTEFGIFFTINGGENWIRLKGGLPTISFRDLEIQRRENDLVAGSFGRSFYILDDYTPLRYVSEQFLKKEAILFPAKKALMYIPMQPLGRSSKGTQGASFFVGENPPFGAIFTYYLREEIKTRQKIRQEKEKEQVKKGESVRYPDWEDLQFEDRELKPIILLTIRDESGAVIRRLTGPVTKGFHRVAWNLRYPTLTPTRIEEGDQPQRRRGAMEYMAAPGKFTVSLAKVVDGVVIPLGEAQTFEAERLGIVDLGDDERTEILEFQQKTAELQRAVMGANELINETLRRLKFILKSLQDAPGAPPELTDKAISIRAELLDRQEELVGDWTKQGRSEPISPSIMARVQTIVSGHWNTTTGPTKTHRQNYEIVGEEFSAFLDKLRRLVETDLKQLETEMEAIGAPWTPGRGVPIWKQ